MDNYAFFNKLIFPNAVKNLFVLKFFSYNLLAKKDSLYLNKNPT